MGHLQVSQSLGAEEVLSRGVAAGDVEEELVVP